MSKFFSTIIPADGIEDIRSFIEEREYVEEREDGSLRGDTISGRTMWLEGAKFSYNQNDDGFRFMLEVLERLESVGVSEVYHKNHQGKWDIKIQKLMGAVERYGMAKLLKEQLESQASLWSWEFTPDPKEDAKAAPRRRRKRTDAPISILDL